MKHFFLRALAVHSDTVESVIFFLKLQPCELDGNTVSFNHSPQLQLCVLTHCPPTHRFLLTVLQLKLLFRNKAYTNTDRLFFLHAAV